MTVVKNPFIGNEHSLEGDAVHAVTVVNKKFHTPTIHDIEIGRPLPLGNVYTHINDRKTRAAFIVRDRGEAIHKHREWVNEKLSSNDEKFLSELKAIHDASKKGPVNLVCYCSPAPCHGDNYKEMLANVKIENGNVVFQPLSLSVQAKKVEQDRKTSVKINLRTHMVIKDHFSEVGFKSILIKDYKDYKVKPQYFFVGTEHDCNAWIKAPAVERSVVEDLALKRWNEKMNNNNSTLDIGKSGVQQSMF